MTETKSCCKRNSLFNAVLFVLSEKNAKLPTEKSSVHKAFYLASAKFPETMKEYSFLTGTQQYSQEITKNYHRFNLDQIITYDLKFASFEIDSSKLEQPDPNSRKTAEYICDLLLWEKQ